ncbi:MAG: response regulator transcription factor [Ndongobacter sp.]|nr:response regulator transcription factor [Ndongobacter sp.]
MSLVYVVEDDVNIRELILYALKTNGYEAAGFAAAEGLFDAAKQQLPDLFLLDIMLDGADGYAILAKLKKDAATKDRPVIMLTARSAEYDKVRGLDMGADDYITKPFGVLELLSRVRAVLRRSGQPEQRPILSCGHVEMDLWQHRVLVSGQAVELNLKEFELLRFLLEHRDRVLSREQIMDHIWGCDYVGESRTVDVHIRMLRQKMGDAGELIQTIRGVGYKLGENR